MSYLPIESHGVIGDLHTVALVGVDGTIDWLCFPHFDSPSVFGSILDERKGGFFRIAAVSPDARRRQMYLPDTNVLVTRFLTPDGVGEVVDFMPIHPSRQKPDREDHRVIRLVRGVRGEIPFRLDCEPAFDYGRRSAKLLRNSSGYRFDAGDHALDLRTTVPLTAAEGKLSAEFVLKEGVEIPVVLCLTEATRPEAEGNLLERSVEEFHMTVRFWQSWIAGNRYHGRWREMVKRSCLTLKMLTYAPTGAIVAAPTTSLPERIGGGRNWDYRYTWIRDSAFTLYALIRVGLGEETEAFVSFLEARSRDLDPNLGLNVLYGIDGRKEVPESILEHLEGYRGSGPVRIGNDAAHQLQLDITGDFLDAVYLYDKYCRRISHEVWVSVRRLADWVCGHWREKDEGIWEVRGGRQDFTFSKLMCWVALDRALRLAARRSLPCDRARWTENRDEIYETIMARGFSRKKNSFVQVLDGESLDAALLLAPMVKFVAPSDPRMVGTLAAIERELISDNLLHRYDPRLTPDGVGGDEGTFSMCTFWLAEAMARAGRHEEARMTFEKMLGYANHLGLYSEEIGPTGEALGNFPQALTHLALISAACNISDALDGKLGGPIPEL